MYSRLVIRKRHACIAVSFVVGALATACGGASTAKPHEQPGDFVKRVLREEVNGQWGRQWTELHPAHQLLISRAQYVECSRQMGTNIAQGKEIFRVIDVRDEPIHVQDVPEQSSKVVTITLRVSGKAPQTYRVHAVEDAGRWAWILGNRFLTQLNRDRCLDGSPLPGRT
jgi:hypothetical protein